MGGRVVAEPVATGRRGSGRDSTTLAVPSRQRPKPGAADVLGHAAERIVSDSPRRERLLEQQPEREPFRVHPPALQEGMDLAHEPDGLGMAPAGDLDFGEVDGEEGQQVMELAPSELLTEALERVLGVFEVAEIARDPPFNPS